MKRSPNKEQRLVLIRGIARKHGFIVVEDRKIGLRCLYNDSKKESIKLEYKKVLSECMSKLIKKHNLTVPLKKLMAAEEAVYEAKKKLKKVEVSMIGLIEYVVDEYSTAPEYEKVTVVEFACKNLVPEAARLNFLTDPDDWMLRRNGIHGKTVQFKRDIYEEMSTKGFSICKATKAVQFLNEELVLNGLDIDLTKLEETFADIIK